MAINLFTIGHSNHPWEKFASLLTLADIRVLADVRSSPRSRLAHFNRGPLTDRLTQKDILYLYMGNALGGRPSGGGPLNYQEAAMSSSYVAALERLEQIAANRTTALMCSEHDPLTCHRCLLVGRSLSERGHVVQHILRDGTIEPHAATEGRLIVRVGKKLVRLLIPETQLLDAAYRLQVLAVQTRK